MKREADAAGSNTVWSPLFFTPVRALTHIAGCGDVQVEHVTYVCDAIYDPALSVSQGVLVKKFETKFDTYCK